MIKYRSISEAADCPLYIQDTDDTNQCFVKYANTLHVLLPLVDTQHKITKFEWDQDCEGNWEKCCFLPFLYDLTDNKEEKKEEEVKHYVNEEIEEYNPFEETEEEETEEDIPIAATKVSINKVSSPWLVESDIIVYPTNVNLLIDDPELLRKSRNKVQQECDQIVDMYLAKGQVLKPGMVIPTSNGENMAGGIVPKRIYHALVAVSSKLVGGKAPMKAITQSLILADQEDAKVVIMLPFDGGVLDIDETARLQLTAIYNYLVQNPSSRIERIHVIMEDMDTFNVYKEYFDRIF